MDFEEQLNLPRIEIHGEVLTLGTGSEDPLCSLEVKWDDAGHLLLAQPHPSLRLDHEATKAVEEDDLGRLPEISDRTCGLASIADSGSVVSNSVLSTVYPFEIQHM